MSLNNIYKYLLVCLVFSSLAFASIVQAEDDPHKNDIHKKDVTGNLVCLIPDYENGTVKPVVGTAPCDGYEPHAHIFVEQRKKVGNVYAVKGSPEALKRLQRLKKKENITVSGNVTGNQDAWVIIVN